MRKIPGHSEDILTSVKDKTCVLFACTESYVDHCMYIFFVVQLSLSGCECDLSPPLIRGLSMSGSMSPLSRVCWWCMEGRYVSNEDAVGILEQCHCSPSAACTTGQAATLPTGWIP